MVYRKIDPFRSTAHLSASCHWDTGLANDLLDVLHITTQLLPNDPLLYSASDPLPAP